VQRRVRRQQIEIGDAGRAAKLDGIDIAGEHRAGGIAGLGCRRDQAGGRRLRFEIPQQGASR